MTDSVRILIAEDDYPLQGVLEEALLEAGFKPEILSSAEQAATLLSSHIFDFRALVTDVNLDRMSGWDLARRAREADPAFPVIYMTGAAADEWAAQGVPGSILLQKPFVPAQLVTALSQLLNTTSPPAPQA
ncbi:response regulator [Bradyrhizobium jicamae]|uniref:response regulator n=1 Tax=Bradyrhizobium jicamae TaxID=280332 RepID=UPI001BA94CDD|nr:response regulator [Bradyrhizobium jicamae]